MPPPWIQRFDLNVWILEEQGQGIKSSTIPFLQDSMCSLLERITLVRVQCSLQARHNVEKQNGMTERLGPTGVKNSNLVS